MSIGHFPPIDVDDKPYAMEEIQGHLITRSREQLVKSFKYYQKQHLPLIDKKLMRTLQHSLSRDRSSAALRFSRSTSSGYMNDRWETTNVLKDLDNTSEPQGIWPITRMGRGLLRVSSSMTDLASKFFNKTPNNAMDLLNEYSHTMEWKTSWIRCIVYHEDGRKLAVCDDNDYVRVFGMTSSLNVPVTLKHVLQTNVASMSWQPFDNRVLAVGADHHVLIWRIGTSNHSLKPSVQCARVINVGFGPISQVLWDQSGNGGLYVSSPNSSTIKIVDSCSEDMDSFGAWTGGSVTKIVPTADGKRFAVLYTTNILRVYEKDSWKNEKWASLDGRAVDAVWSLDGENLVFATETGNDIFCLNFTYRINSDSTKEWTGSSTVEPIFDISAIIFNSTDINQSSDRPLVAIGGSIFSMKLSPDGQRLVVTFKENREIIALFFVDWYQPVRLVPGGLIEAPEYGFPSIVSFVPKFDKGSLLQVVWSEGIIQYIPLYYGPKAAHVSQPKITRKADDSLRFNDSLRSVALLDMNVSSTVWEEDL